MFFASTIIFGGRYVVIPLLHKYVRVVVPGWDFFLRLLSVTDLLIWQLLHGGFEATYPRT